MTHEPDVEDVSIEYITPEDAKVYLEMNDGNRNPKPSKIDGFVRDMQEGKWRWNGETIKFDTNQRLIDGQNRLLALSKSNVEGLWFLVVYNVEREAQSTIDTGTARTFSDTLKMRGIVDPTRIAGATRLVYLWQHGSRAFRASTMAPTINELLKTLEENPSIQDGMRESRRVSLKTPLTPSASLFLYFLFAQLSETDAKDFFDQLVSMENLSATSPILQLHNALERLNKRSQGTSSYLIDIQIALTIKAWNKYRNGEPCSQLRFLPGGANPESFPEPI